MEEAETVEGERINRVVEEEQEAQEGEEVEEERIGWRREKR